MSVNCCQPLGSADELSGLAGRFRPAIVRLLPPVVSLAAILPEILSL